MTNSIMVRVVILVFFYIGVFGQLACKKLIDVDAPVTSITSQSAFTNDATATSTVTGLYTSLSSTSLFQANGLTNISLYAGLSADELTLYSGITNISLVAYYKNDLSTSTGGFEYWGPLYNYVFKCNAIIQGLEGSESLSLNVKKQLMGEARFMRAFFYFYLVNLFGEVPIVEGLDYTENSKLSRSSKPEVYTHIITDLKAAQDLLSESYLNGNLQTYTGTAERVRPTKWAATALLARAYLYSGDNINAETEATRIIDNPLFSLIALNDVFKKNSSEAIWQLQPVRTGWNTEDAKTFIIPSSGPGGSNPVFLSTDLLNSFENGDQRKVIGNWINTIKVQNVAYFYPYKYKINTQNTAVTAPGALSEYLMVLRLGEQYLIRAEARARQEKINGANQDLSKIRVRAGLALSGITDKATLLTAILHERQVELFTEWGHRWLDLIRNAYVDAVMVNATLVKGGTWNPKQKLYPIPIGDVQKNPNLIQNDGY